jgi:hypothetical protein
MRVEDLGRVLLGYRDRFGERRRRALVAGAVRKIPPTTANSSGATIEPTSSTRSVPIAPKVDLRGSSLSSRTAEGRLFAAGTLRRCSDAKTLPMAAAILWRLRMGTDRFVLRISSSHYARQRRSASASC